MPAVISHYLLAERVFRKISPSIPELERNIFLWGANGPDIFFSHRLMPWQMLRSLSKVSHIMHGTKAEIILNYLYEYSRVTEDYAAMSYAFGFVTHYAYDSIAHPYIVDYAEKISNGKTVKDVISPNSHFSQIVKKINLSSVYHNKLEGSLDTIMLMHEGRGAVYKFRLEDTSPKDKQAYHKTAEILTSCLTASDIAPDINEHEIIRAMIDWRISLRVLNDRLSLKRNSVKGLEKLFKLPPIVSVFFRNIDIDLSEDPANLQHNQWVSPVDGSIHSESFFELTDKAEEKSLYLIRKLQSGIPLTRDDCVSPFSGHLQSNTDN